MAPEIISRSDAKSKDLSRYFTGKPCKYGHYAERRTVNGVCTVCYRDIEERHRDKNREQFRAKWRKASASARKCDPEKNYLKNKKWINANRDKVIARKQRWRKANPGKYADQEKAYRAARPEKIRLQNKLYKTANAERLAPIAIERTKRWQAENPERHRANAAKVSQHRRARILKASGSYTQKQIDNLLEKQNWVCATPPCGTSLRERKELDHIIAIARGGSNDIANLQWLCPRCNRKKNAKSPTEWALACELLFSTKDQSP